MVITSHDPKLLRHKYTLAELTESFDRIIRYMAASTFIKACNEQHTSDCKLLCPFKGGKRKKKA